MESISNIIKDAVKDTASVEEDVSEGVSSTPDAAQLPATPTSSIGADGNAPKDTPSIFGMAEENTGNTQEAQRALVRADEEIDNSTSPITALGHGFNLNIAPQIYDAVQRKYSATPDENFVADDYYKLKKHLLPVGIASAFDGVQSKQEADELIQDVLSLEEDRKILQAKGFTGIAAQFLAGLADVDVLLIPLTGGTVKAATTLGRVAKAAAVGAAEGTAVGAAYYVVDPLAETKEIVLGALGGVVLGSVGGLAGGRANASVAEAKQEYSKQVDDLPDATVDTPDVSNPYFNDDINAQHPEEGSVGAARVGKQDKLDMSEFNSEHMSIWLAARRRIQEEGLAERYDFTDLRTDSPTARVAKRFSDALSLQKKVLGAKNVYDRFTQDGGALELLIGHDLFESASGRVRNYRTASILQSSYINKLDGTSIKQINNSYNSWAKKRGIGVLSKEQTAQRNVFDKEVILETESRFHDGQGQSTNQDVIDASDAWQNNANLAQDIKRGREDELSVSGSEDAKHIDGYIFHQWSGRSMRNAINKIKKEIGVTSSSIAKKRIVALFVKGYKKTYPDLDDAKREIIARAVVRRALNGEKGVDENLLRGVDKDGQDYLREVLIDSNVPKKAVDDIMITIKGKSDQQGQLGSNKHRRQVDLRTTDGTISLVDLIESNLNNGISRYNRSVAGASALARKGIQNRGQRKTIIDAIQAERVGKGLSENREYIEDSFSHFDAGPIAGGVSPTVGRLKRITSLSLLNQMGIPQLAETGIQIMAVGMGTWQRHARSTLAQMRKDGPEGDIARELRVQTGNLTDEHLIHRNELMLDEMRAESAGELDKYLNTLDNVLIKGQRIQGYISGFYKIKEFQQQVAITAMADKVWQRIRDGVDSEKLHNIGIDPDRFKKYLDGVEFDEAGFTNRLNMDKWDPSDAEAFALALHRHTRQVVQAALAGEESIWISKTLGSMYFHLKTFPLLAMQKQTIQAAQNGGPELAATVAASMATAGLFYEARQLINGKTDNISPEHALKGAIGLSNTLGWIPMIVDPVSSILGIESLNMSPFTRPGVDTGILSTPPILPHMNKLGHVLAAGNPFSELSGNNRIRTLQALPLVGNAIGFSALFNSMKE